MALTTIEWCYRRHPITGAIVQGYTFNGWIGCTEASPACKYCYAKAQDDMRFSHTLGGGTKDVPISHWGKGAPRYRTSPANWKEPLRWNEKAKQTGIAPAVFCSSLSDVFDEEVPDEWRDDILELVHATKNLDWMILTKRPKKMNDYLTSSMWWLNDTPQNVWLGATMETQKYFDERIDYLLGTPAKYHFASMEPLLGKVDITKGLGMRADGDLHVGFCPCCQGEEHSTFLDLVIAGGESHQQKAKARPTHPDWALDIAAQCWATGTEFFWKQWGEWAPAYELQDPQAQAMCAMGKVLCHEWPDGEEGRKLTFNVGSRIAGAHFEGELRNLPLQGRLLT